MFEYHKAVSTKLSSCSQAGLLSLLILAFPAFAATTVDLSDTVVAPKSSMGVNVGSASANIVNGGCFEAGADGNGFAYEGWGWFKAGGTYTASVDTSTFVSGKQSQKISVSAAPATMEQAAVDLPQLKLTRVLTPSGAYVIKAMLKSDVANSRVQLGIVDGGWGVHYSPVFNLTTTWTAYSWTYTSASTDLWRGVAVTYLDNANYWIDNLASWDANNIDPATGFVKTYVDRLKELKPTMLRLGGLGVNGMTLEHYLFKPWPLSYGPPPNEYLNINTFMTLCKVANASAFITVPPAFTDTASAATQTDLTVDLVNNHYSDHGNIVDYLGGDNTTTYGARRIADGFARWDTQTPFIYYEMGNETWGTPDGKWDMHLGLSGDPWMQTYATYCTKRMTDMKGRAGWRSNMRVGFGGFAADSDSWAGYSTILIPAIKTLADFGTIFMYYGSGDNTNTDEQIYGGLFAKAQWHQRVIGNMNATYAAAAGHTVECCIYEGNCVWGNYYNGPSANDMFDYSHEVSAGAAVSLLDNYAAGNHAGVVWNNHFAFTGGSWSSLTDEPNYYRKPAYQALKIFNNYISGNMITSTVSGAGTWNDTITSEQNVPYVACYPYKSGSNYSILLVNRHRTTAQTITINRPLTVSQLVSLSAADINANNETGENVTMQVQTVSSSGNSYTVTVPPFSAYLVTAQDYVPSAPTVSLTSPANGAIYAVGANISLTATAASSSSTISKVEFYKGTTLLGTATTSPYTFAWNNVSAGQYALTAKATDGNGLSTTSSTVNITVNAPPTVSLTSPANGAIYAVGANISLTAIAASTSSMISKVEFYKGTTLLGTATTSPYTFAWNNVGAGQYALTAKATDGNGFSTTSSTVNITVNAPPTVSLTSPANGANYATGANISLTATAASTSSTISKVEFYKGTTLLGTATTSPYTFAWNNISAGQYALTAKATDGNGLSKTSSTVNITVNAPPTVSLTSPTNGASFSVGANILLTATAASSSSTVSKVEFFQGTTLLGTATTSPYSFTWNNVSAGNYSLTAKVTDGNGLTATSSPVSSSVAIPHPLPPTVNLTSPANGAMYLAGSSVSLTATAASSGATVSKVEFYQGSTLLGTDTVSPYTCTWNNVAAGQYALTAKATDSNGLSTTSSIVNIIVNNSVPLTITSVATAFPNPAGEGQMVNLAVGASGNAGDTLTYTWDLGDGNQGVGASMNHAFLAAGTYTVSVTVDDSHGGIVSSTLSVQVNAAVVGTGIDSDGDGFSDSFESGVGTDPGSAINTPTGTPITVDGVMTLTIKKASVKLNFAKSGGAGAKGSDSISFAGTVAVPAGFNSNGAKTFFIVGGVIKTLVLTAKGGGVSGGDSVKVSFKSKKGVVLATPTAKYSVNFKKGNFAATLAATGLTNSNVKAVPVTVPFTFIFNNVVYQKTQTMYYTARKGKMGVAK